MSRTEYDEGREGLLARVRELEGNERSLLVLIEELYARVHRVEKVLIDEETIDALLPALDERGEEGLFDEATAFVRESGTCSVSHLQKRFKIPYTRAFALLDLLEADGVIAPYRGRSERVINQ